MDLCPPAFLPVLLYECEGSKPPLRTPLGDIPAVSLHPPPIRDRAASDQGPRHRTATYGVVAARRPPMSLNVQPRTYRNLCCLVVYDVTCQPGTQRKVMWRC